MYRQVSMSNMRWVVNCKTNRNDNLNYNYAVECQTPIEHECQYEEVNE